MKLQKCYQPALHCSQESLTPTLLLGSALCRMGGIKLSSGPGWEGQRLLAYSLSPTNPKVFWLTDAKVVFQCLVSLRYKLRLCFPLSLLDIANNTELLIKSIFLFPKQAARPQDSQEDVKCRRCSYMMTNNQVILSWHFFKLTFLLLLFHNWTNYKAVHSEVL